jgi:hypothetical protein
MSTTFAIAAVTATMRHLLNQSLNPFGIDDVLSDVRITAVPPHQVEADEPRLNLFLYRAQPNPGWQQEDLPSRNDRGERISNPYLPLDLHYLITAHGAGDFQGEILLGYAMQIFHEQPVFTRDLIREALDPNQFSNADPLRQLMTVLAASELADQFEQIKLSLHTPASEELANYWSAMQSGYVPTACYKASVVLIRSRRTTSPGLPVRQFTLDVVPISQPVLEQVVPVGPPGSPVVVGTTLTVRGQALRGLDTRLRLGAVEISGGNLTVTNERITFAVPNVARAGVQGVQVLHYRPLGTPPQPRLLFESNILALVLQPRLNGAPQEQAAASGVPRKLLVTVEPLVAPNQRGTLLLTETGVAAPRAFTADADPRPATAPPTAQLAFTIPDTLAGDFLVRVRVDGAESPLTFDAVTQRYNAPQVTL